MTIVEVHYAMPYGEHSELFGPFASNHEAQKWAKDLLTIASNCEKRFAVGIARSLSFREVNPT